MKRCATLNSAFVILNSTLIFFVLSYLCFWLYVDPRFLYSGGTVPDSTVFFKGKAWPGCVRLSRIPVDMLIAMATFRAARQQQDYPWLPERE